MSDSIEASELFKRIEAEYPVEDWALAKLRVMAMSSIPVIDKAFTDLKEENKRLREALEGMVQRYDAAEESSEIWDGPDYLGSYNMFQAECSEIIGIARSALKEE